MIKYVKRNDLDTEKYDACIENSLQSRVYGFSWYLDIVADHWDVLVLKDYEAVMPIPWRRKMGISYVYPPFWLLELGVFSLNENVNTKLFLYSLFKHYKFIESKLNTNLSKLESSFIIDKQMQVLDLQKDLDSLFEHYRKDRKKDLKKAVKAGLVSKWNEVPKSLIHLFKNNVGKRTPFIVAKDYTVLLQLMKTCIAKGVGELLSIYNEEKRLVAAGFFLKHKNAVTILVSATDFNCRKNGENTFLIHKAIEKYQKDYNVFNFGGSSMPSIAAYFKSFGASTLQYQQIKYNNLPFWLKIFKA